MKVRGATLMLLTALVSVSVLIGPSSSSAQAAAAPPDIVAATTQIAQTPFGAVGYREIGHGPTLLMITGFSAGMDDWAPYLIDALAEHFRVVLFDNAGVGQTANLAAPLSVPEMAAQTSALISTLKLGRCDVLGWSMGGLIAQSLAASDPKQVGHLVLAATQAGTGKAIPVSATAQAGLNSGNPAVVLSYLFPSTQTSATKKYVAGILSYSGYYTASPATRSAQQGAIDQWFAGDDPTGRHPGSIKARTLVADGSVDALNPVSNDHMLAHLIHGARLVVYPGAGHGFLFQDSTSFAHELVSFLG